MIEAIEPMSDITEIKQILEAALLVAGEPVADLVAWSSPCKLSMKPLRRPGPGPTILGTNRVAPRSPCDIQRGAGRVHH